MTSSTPKEVVEWGSDGRGILKVGGMSVKHVFRRSFWLRERIRSMIKNFVQTPELWDPEKRLKIGKVKFSFDLAFSCEYPRLYHTIIEEFAKRINEQLDIILPEVCTTLEKNIRLSDFQFLCKLTMTRNWKSGCGICLTDKIMGTKCSCGHTEISVLRPCGHSFCTSPCFKEFMESKEQILKPKIIKIGDQKFVLPDILDPSQVTSFECPYCRSTVEKVISAETVCCDETFKVAVDHIFKEVTKGYESLFVEEK